MISLAGVIIERARRADLGISCGRPSPPDGSFGGKRRLPGGMCARSSRDVAEAHVERHVGDRAGVVGQQARCMAQPRAQQILVRRHAENSCEQPQEVKRAQARPALRRPRDRSARASERPSRARLPPRACDRVPTPPAAFAAARRRPRQSALRTTSRPRRGRRRYRLRRQPAPARPAPSARAAAARRRSARSRSANSGSLGRSFRPAPARDGRTGIRRRTRGARACTCTRRRDGRPGPSRPPARTISRACDNRSCLAERRRRRSRRAARRTASRPGPTAAPVVDHRDRRRVRRRVIVRRVYPECGAIDPYPRYAPAAARYLLASSTARHRYQLATVR